MLPTVPSPNPIGDIASMANFIQFQKNVGEEKKSIWVNMDAVRWMEANGIGETMIHFDETDKFLVEGEPEAVVTQSRPTAVFAGNRTSRN
jgi:hypothetical protein